MVAAFLAGVARYYHPPFGLTALIDFPAATHTDELPIVQQTPHYDDPISGSGYDGQYYSQLAIDPLLRDPRLDRAMDNPPYRAHRILFSWTAWAIGLGRPAWILNVYAAQNIVAWLILALLLCRWLPPQSLRNFLLWTGCLLGHGLIMSVRFALVDGPSLVLITLAVIAAERQRPIVAALVIGISGLGRETNVLAASLFAGRLGRDVRSWLLVAGCLALCLLPMALWLDYLRSIYRSLALSGGDNLSIPFEGLAWKFRSLSTALANPLQRSDALVTLCAVLGFLTQGLYIVATLFRRDGRTPWTLVGASFLLLVLATHQVVWAGTPGAFGRAALPLAVATNVRLAKGGRASWPIIVLANLGVVPGVLLWWFA